MILHIDPEFADTHSQFFLPSRALHLVRRDAVIFGRLVVRQRKVLGLSQQAVADRASLSRITVSEIERGIASPNRHTLGKLMEALGITASDIAADLAALDDAHGHDIPEDLNGLEISHARYDNLRQEAA